MTNTDLNSANEEIRRLRLLLGLKSDGSLNLSGDEDNIRSEMLLRMSIMSEIDEMMKAKRDMEDAYNKHVVLVDKCNTCSKEVNESYVAWEKNKEKRERLDKERYEVIESRMRSVQNIKETRKRESEIISEIASTSKIMDNMLLSNKEKHMSYENCKALNEEAKGTYIEIKKKYDELELKVNPRKRKEIESISKDFDEKVTISEKKTRSSSF